MIAGGNHTLIQCELARNDRKREVLRNLFRSPSSKQGILVDFTHYTEFSRKSKPYVFGFLRENFLRTEKKYAKSVKSLKIFEKYPCQTGKNAV